MSRIEQGKLGKRPGGTLKRISRALGVREDWLLWGTGEKHESARATETPRLDETPEWPKVIATVRALAPDLESSLATIAAYRVPHPVDAEFGIAIARHAQRLSGSAAKKA